MNTRGIFVILFSRVLTACIWWWHPSDKSEVMRSSSSPRQCKFLPLFNLFLLVLSAPVLAIDSDNDGLPDDWELANGRDPLVVDYAVSAWVETIMLER